MGELQVEISPETVSLVKQFLRQPAKQDQGGILLGTVKETEKGLKVDITGAIAANPHESFIKEFHYDHTIWRELYAEKAEKYPDLDILGWYRSSQASGLIPSANDVAIQKAYFNDKHQIFLMANPDDFKHCIFQWEKNFLMPLDQTDDETEEANPEKEQIFASPSKFPELAKEVEILMEQSSHVSSQVNSMLENKHSETAQEDQSAREPIPLGLKLMGGLAGILTLITLTVYPLIKTADTSEVNPKPSLVLNQQEKKANQQPVVPAPSPTVKQTKTAVAKSSGTNTNNNTNLNLNPNSNSNSKTYTVQPGDSLWKISEELYGSGLKFYLLISANGLTTPSHLNAGLVLVVPPDTE